MSAALKKDILLDDSAFDTAVSEFRKLSDEMAKLKAEIEAALESLKKGFDTPAGEKFISTYRESLLKPLNEQATVLEHVSQVLNEAKTSYQSVFESYKTINTYINNVQI
ncbi:MAG: hypothetical protein LBT59_14790 [Clostridiales bacterium]|nr:hypothetical protein [Clostridiales bacterium]